MVEIEMDGKFELKVCEDVMDWESFWREEKDHYIH